jgi:glutaredoxin
MAQVNIYTISLCSDCEVAKRFLNEQNIPSEEINSEQVDWAVDIVMQANQERRSVPTLDIGGQFVTCSPFDRRKLP